MPDYRRNLIPGGTFFFTVTLRDRRSNFLGGERGIWQHRYWEHTIHDARDYAAHMDYIHFNPVKHGYVARPQDWLYSTFRSCVAKGLYPAQWSSGHAEPPETGERR